ncbi:MAG: biotin--[acetyl-CoA-carboxylase] ligase [Gammaproteobacteria bacterium]|nr:biotin--[acetyl-CoA-carboxylase] ligase [Gammaproteobacteria bacterium]
MTPLDGDEIVALLPPPLAELLQGIEVKPLTGSTNSDLIAALRSGSISPPALLLANEQTSGRGRRGSCWISPPDANIYLSFAWSVTTTPPALLGTLSLTTAVAIARTLIALGLAGVGLKWPNDVWVEQRKIAGTLIEMVQRQEMWCAVIGIGLNYAQEPFRNSDPAVAAIPRPWTDICHELRGSLPPGRNRVVALLLENLLLLLQDLALNGFDEIQREWQRLDLLRGRRIRVESEQGDIEGVAAGVAADGALCLEQGDGLRLITSGHIELI